MKNFIQNGDYLQVNAPKDVRSGELLAIGSLVGVVVADALKGSQCSLAVGKVYALPKEQSTELKTGQAVAAKDGLVVPIAKDLPYAGVVTQDTGQDKTTVNVWLK